MTDTFYGVFRQETDGYSYNLEEFYGIFDDHGKAEAAALKIMRDYYPNVNQSAMREALSEKYTGDIGLPKLLANYQDTVYEFRWEDDELRVYKNDVLAHEGNHAEIKLITVNEVRQ